MLSIKKEPVFSGRRRSLLSIERTVHKTPHSGGDHGQIGIGTSSGIEIISLSEVSHCISEDNYCRIVFRAGVNPGDQKREVLVSKTLKEVEYALRQCTDGNDDLIRVHHSYLIRLTEVIRVHHHHVVLNDATKIPIARSKRTEFTQHLKTRITMI
jgi:hypothetical protein